MSSRKPTLVLTTPVSATFPAEALKSAASVRTPHSALWRDAAMPSAGLPSAGLPSAGLSSAGLYSPLVTIKTEDGLLKTPITPPLAYMDFLKMASPVLPSPVVASPTCGMPNKTKAVTSTPAVTSTTTTATPEEEPVDDKDTEADNASASTSTSSSTPTSSSSMATSARSSTTDCSSCDCNNHYHKSPKIARIDTSMPPSPFGHYPMSAPAIGRTTFPNLSIPPSPATSNAGRPDPQLRSPFSARSVVSPFDWDSHVTKARHVDVKPLPHTHTCSKSPTVASTRTSVRHIREVITRTVTYTPRMNPAPKGKKRKAECSGTACS